MSIISHINFSTRAKKVYHTEWCYIDVHMPISCSTHSPRLSTKLSDMERCYTEVHMCITFPTLTHIIHKTIPHRAALYRGSHVYNVFYTLTQIVNKTITWSGIVLMLPFSKRIPHTYTLAQTVHKNVSHRAALYQHSHVYNMFYILRLSTKL